MLRLRRKGIVFALSFVVFAAVSSSTPAYYFHGYKWPGGIVKYYNAASDQAWAVNQAVRAWNTSGAHIRFVPAARADAQLMISDPASKIYCAEGHASVGYVRNAHVVIFPAHGITHGCNRYWAARMMAHELGHVLGLEHEDRYCAAMNEKGSLRGGRECEPKLLWAWRCRLLEPDDVAGVAAIYGGNPRPAKSPELCPLYRGIPAPANLTADFDSTAGTVTLAFRRPADPAIPGFVVPSPWHSRASFALSGLGTSCGTNDPPEVAPRFRWHVKPGDRETFTTAVARRRYCFEVWAVDELGRPSDRPAAVSISIS